MTLLEGNEVPEPLRLVVPGTRICDADDNRFLSGSGTYVLHGSIYSSLVGTLNLSPVPSDGKEKDHKVMKVEVESRRKELHSLVPAVGDIVTARVLSVNPRQGSIISVHTYIHTYFLHDVRSYKEVLSVPAVFPV